MAADSTALMMGALDDPMKRTVVNHRETIAADRGDVEPLLGPAVVELARRCESWSRRGRRQGVTVEVTEISPSQYQAQLAIEDRGWPKSVLMETTFALADGEDGLVLEVTSGAQTMVELMSKAVYGRDLRRLKTPGGKSWNEIFTRQIAELRGEGPAGQLRLDVCPAPASRASSRPAQLE